MFSEGLRKGIVKRQQISQSHMHRSGSEREWGKVQKLTSAQEEGLTRTERKNEGKEPSDDDA